VLFVAQELDRSEARMICGLAARGVRPVLMISANHARQAPAVDSMQVIPGRLEKRIELSTMRAIRRVIREKDIALVHCLRSNCPVSNVLQAVRGLPTPIICYRGTMGNLSRWNPGAWLTYLNRRIKRIICVSNAVASSLQELGVPAERLVTIYKGHDPQWYETRQRPGLSEFDIPEGSFVVGCAANMRPLKGADVLIRSADHLQSKRSVHFLLIGEVRDPKIHSLVRHPPYSRIVHLAGFRTDATSLLGACDVAVMPSLRREGLPRAIIEAMSQEVPAIVTNVGGMPELVEDQRCGMVVPPNDPSALGAAISRLAENEAERIQLGRAARARIETKFSIEKTTDETFDLYRQLLS